MSATKVGDKVILVVEGSEYPAEVTAVYEGQDYVDLKTLGLSGLHYPTVNPGKEGDLKFFRKATKDEVKEVKEAETDAAVPAPGQAPAARPK